MTFPTTLHHSIDGILKNRTATIPTTFPTISDYARLLLDAFMEHLQVMLSQSSQNLLKLTIHEKTIDSKLESALRQKRIGAHVAGPLS